MTDDNHNHRLTVEHRLDTIDAKLDRLDEAIRGNHTNGSKPSILVRLDRLEQDAKRQSRLIWLIVGAVVTATTSAFVAWMSGGPAPGVGG